MKIRILSLITVLAGVAHAATTPVSDPSLASSQTPLVTAPSIENAANMIEAPVSNAGLILDYHPFGGVFRISAGLNYSKMCLNAKGTMEHNLAGEYDFGGYQFKVEGKDFFKIADDIFVYPFIQLGMGYRF